MKIAIIVLNFNGLKETLACLDSIKKLEKNNIDLEIFVVDNNSEDGSQEALSKITGINLIQNKDNLGYTGGNNVGINAALEKQAEYLIVVNNDTILDKLFLKNILSDAKDGDIVSPKIYFEKGFEFHKDRYSKAQLGRVIWYAGGEIDWQNILGIHTGVDEVDSGQYDKRREINFATGACMMVSRKVFEKIGLFDDKYFLYLEDMDFSHRAKKAGFKIIFEPKAILWHKNAMSQGGTGSKLQDYYISRNRLLFAIKYAKLRTKLALFKQILMSSDKIRKRALFDFLTFKFGRAKFAI